jgi:hypothetical protein
MCPLNSACAKTTSQSMYNELSSVLETMLRKSISCMLAGLPIAGSALSFIYAADTSWLPHKIVPVVAIFIGVVGIIWLFDEIRGHHPRRKAIGAALKDEMHPMTDHRKTRPANPAWRWRTK